jgi:hypothetical protein
VIVLSRRRRRARAVHEEDLPEASLFLQDSRFQPLLVHGARGVRDAALIDVSDPSLLPLMWMSGSVTFHS